MCRLSFSKITRFIHSYRIIFGYIFIAVSIQLIILVPLFASQPELDVAEPSSLFAWLPRSDALVDRVEAVGAVVDRKLYVFGGFVDTDLHISPFVDRYDPATDKWEQIGEMPAPVSHITPAVDGTTIWLAGGFLGDHPGPATANVWQYDAISGSWQAGPPLPEARAGGVLIRYERMLHYFGGFKNDRETTTSDHWTLNLDGGQVWQAAVPMPTPRGHQSGIVLQEHIYLIGGQTGHDQNPLDHPNVYRYDPALQSWTEVAQLPAPRSHFESAIFTLRDQIVIIGGRTNTIPGQGQLTTALLYDPTADIWIALPKLPYTRIGTIAQLFDQEIIVTTGGLQWNNPQRSTLSGTLDDTWELEHPAMPLALPDAAGDLLAGKIYIVGTGTQELLAYDLANDVWAEPSTLSPAPMTRSGQVLAAYGERLYLFGASDTGSVQIYDPLANQWSQGAMMPATATEVMATVVDDVIYVAWYRDGAAPVSGMARYDPLSNSWQDLAAPPYARSGAALAHYGQQIYLFGGREGERSSDTVQAYSPASNSWSTSLEASGEIVALPIARSDARAVQVSDEIYLVGGASISEGAASTVINEIHIYRPATRSWRAGTHVPTRRSDPAVVLVAERLYVMGGSTSDAMPSSALEVYNAVPVLPAATFMPTSIVLPDPSITGTPITGMPIITPLPTTSTPVSDPAEQPWNIYLPFSPSF